MKHLNLTITGKVQGVDYRASCKAVADLLGIKGFVMNQPDGSVYIEAEGDCYALKELLEFCQEGPEQAEVAEMHSEEASWQGYKNFEVLKRKK